MHLTHQSAPLTTLFEPLTRQEDDYNDLSIKKIEKTVHQFKDPKTGTQASSAGTQQELALKIRPLHPRSNQWPS